MAEVKETYRIEAFSDAVFAIAITLLILEIEIPHLKSNSPWELASALQKLWPSYLAFLMSFIFILISWINHHSLFNLIQKCNRFFLFANGILLLAVSSLPFPTEVVAKYINTHAANVAVVFYGFFYILLNIGFQVIWRTAKAYQLFKTTISQNQVKRVIAYQNFGFFVYVSITIIAFWYPYISLFINAIMWIIWARLKYRDN